MHAAITLIVKVATLRGSNQVSKIRIGLHKLYLGLTGQNAISCQYYYYHASYLYVIPSDLV